MTVWSSITAECRAALCSLTAQCRWVLHSLLAVHRVLVLHNCYGVSSGVISYLRTNSCHILTKSSQTTQPPYLHNLVSVQPPRSTRSSSIVTVTRPPTSSSLRITDCFFRFASPWINSTPYISPSTSSQYILFAFSSSFTVDSPLSTYVTPLLFDSQLKTYLSDKYLPLYIYRLSSALLKLGTAQVLKAVTLFCPLLYSAPQCSHCKRCRPTSYSNSVRLSVSKRRHVARCSLHCQIAKCV